MPNMKHDIFVSYAHVDDQVVPGAEKGWITTFMKGLRAKLDQKLGRKDFYDVWMDFELRRNTPFAENIHNELKNSHCLLVFLSPGYRASEWCQSELTAFLSQDPDLSSIFVVEIIECDRPEQLTKVLGYRCWVRDDQGIARTLASPLPDPQREPQYFQLLDDVSRELADHIKQIPQQHAEPQEFDIQHATQGTVFLAEATADLCEQRRQVVRFLEQRNYQVLPKQNYSFLEKQPGVVRDLQEADLFVQLLSAYSGDEYPLYQFEQAQQAGLKALLWHVPNLSLEGISEKHLALLECEHVIVTELTAFQTEIASRLDTIINPVVNAVSVKNANVDFLVFVNHCLDDEDIAQNIRDILSNEGIGYSMPFREAGLSASEIRKDLEDNLTYCDALVIPYDKAPPSWVREQLMQCLRVRSKREKPIKVISICATTPPAKPQININLPQMQWLEYPNLSKFLEAVQS